MDSFIQRVLENLQDSVFPSMSPTRRVRKLAMVTTITGRGRSEKKKENLTPLTSVKAVAFRQTSADEPSAVRESGDAPAQQKVSEPAERLRNARGLARRLGMLRSAATKTAAPKSRESDTRSAKEEVKRSNSVPVEVHHLPKEAEPASKDDSAIGAPDRKRLSVEWNNLLSAPSVSTANLLEEIEADLPSPYSLASVLDHTLHTITNARTCARLSRVGTNLTQTEVEAKKVHEAEQDPLTRLKALQREAFVQKTLIDQADKAVKLCKIRKKHLEFEDLGLLKALLLAKLRYNALDLEIQNHEMYGSDTRQEDSAELSITDVHFRLSESLDSDTDYYICIAVHREKVFSSQFENKVVGGKIHFPVDFKFEHLRQNFMIFIDFFRFNITAKSGKDAAKLMDLKRFMQMASHVISGRIEGARNEKLDFVRVGSALLRLNDAKRRCRGSVVLDVNGTSPLPQRFEERARASSIQCGGSFRSTVSVNLKMRVIFHSRLNGFLDMFKNAYWRRLWCCHTDYYLHFWSYPEDKDNGKAPFESVFLPNCEDDVKPVGMDVCIRPHSFVVPYKNGGGSVLLSSCSTGDMVNWINCLNSCIRCLQAWSPDY